MKTLLVAPQQPDLVFQQQEVQRLVNTFDGAKVLIGPTVTWANVADEIQRVNPDVLWFSTHGHDAGIVLTDTDVDGDMLASVTRGTNVRLIVLNTCDSRSVAERIHAATGCDIVATVGPVDDRHAFTVAQRFAVLLASKQDPFEAFNLVKTAQFIYIPEMAYNRGDYEGLRRLVVETQMENDRLRRMLDELRENMQHVMEDCQTFRAEQNARQAEQARQFKFYQNAITVFGVILAIVLVLQLAQVFQ